jgi:hypothetical protein
MKKTTLLMTAAIVTLIAFAVYKNNTATSANNNLTDTTGLAQFQQWKLMQAETEANKAFAATQKTAANKASGAKTVTMTSSTTNEGKVAKKKGWSKSAKYAVIGTTGGAVMGALINKKNPVKGAIIGGVVLGGGGYVFGRSQDKKEGRY